MTSKCSRKDLPPTVKPNSVDQARLVECESASLDGVGIVDPFDLELFTQPVDGRWRERDAVYPARLSLR